MSADPPADAPLSVEPGRMWPIRNEIKSSDAGSWWFLYDPDALDDDESPELFVPAPVEQAIAATAVTPLREAIEAIADACMDRGLTADDVADTVLSIAARTLAAR